MVLPRSKNRHHQYNYHGRSESTRWWKIMAKKLFSNKASANGQPQPQPQPQAPIRWKTKQRNSYSTMHWIVGTVLFGVTLWKLICFGINQSSFSWHVVSSPSPPPPPPPARRFPKYESDEFSKRCPWVNKNPSSPSLSSSSCITYVTPKPKEHEGVAEWMNKIVIGFIDSRIRGCRLLMDYGPGIDIRQVLQNPMLNFENKHYPFVDWNVPNNNFECKKNNANDNDNANENNCFNFASETRHNVLTSGQWKSKDSVLRPSGIHIPNYRHAFKNLTKVYDIYANQFTDIEKALPGFDLMTGVACALGSVVDLAPSAAIFQRDLFSTILPQLRKETSLVITLYLRTGQTDIRARAEKEHKNDVVEPASDEYFEQQKDIQDAMQCTIELETEYLRQSQGYYTDVTWLIMSDSVPLKHWVQTKYQGETAKTATKTTTTTTTTAKTQRNVLITTAKGTHTRAARGPSGTDFAEAMIDWFLMGESDLMVSSDPKLYSFGTMAGLRTNLPMYDTTECSQLVLIKGEKPPI